MNENSATENYYNNSTTSYKSKKNIHEENSKKIGWHEENSPKNYFYLKVW